MTQKPPFELTGNWKCDIAAIALRRCDDFFMYPDEQVLNDLYRHIEVDNYTQILYDYGQEYVKFCLLYFQEIEDYERCAVIVRQVEDFNRTQGTRIVLKIS